MTSVGARVAECRVPQPRAQLSVGEMLFGIAEKNLFLSQNLFVRDNAGDESARDVASLFTTERAEKTLEARRRVPEGPFEVTEERHDVLVFVCRPASARATAPSLLGPSERGARRPSFIFHAPPRRRRQTYTHIGRRRRRPRRRRTSGALRRMGAQHVGRAVRSRLSRGVEGAERPERQSTGCSHGGLRHVRGRAWQMYCPPRHATLVEPSFLELRCIL